MQTSSEVSKKINPLFFLAVIGLLLVFICVGMSRTATPAISATEPSADSFSAAHAMLQLQKIARVPHALGTIEHDAVRDELLTELKTLGLVPQIQTDWAVGLQASSAALVQNIIVRIPGRSSNTDTGKALLLTAHYDSVPNGPGAADDGASVAAILETIRALKLGAPLQNDVICVISDGEEPGLLGAEAFAADHPLFKQVGLVLNFDFRGNSGPMLMFETSANNGKLIAGFAQSVAHPVANSLMNEIYQRMPNGTDLTVYLRAGIPGINFAAIDNAPSYHSQLDRPELMNAGTLQHEGDIMLAMVRYFGNQPLDHLTEPNQIYFDYAGLGLVHYPSAWVLPFDMIVVLLFVITFVMGRRTMRLRIGRSVLGAFAFPVMVVVVAGLCQILWMGISAVTPTYHAMGDLYNCRWNWAAFAALATSAFVLLQAALKRWISAEELSFGAALVWILLLIASSAWMPGATFLLTWPLLVVLFSWLAIYSTSGRTASAHLQVLLLTLGVAAGLVLIAPLTYLTLLGLSTNMIGVAMVMPGLLLGIAAPLLNALSLRNSLAGLLFAVASTCFAIAYATSGFDTRHPAPDTLFYAKDGASGKGFWLSTDATLDDWTQRYFQGVASKRKVPELFGKSQREFWISPAPAVSMPAPIVEILNDDTTATERTLRFRVRSLRSAPMIKISVDGADVFSSSVAGHFYSSVMPGSWTLSAFAVPADGIQFEIHVAPQQSPHLTVRDISYGLTAVETHIRPEDKMFQPFGPSDTLQIFSHLDVK